MPLHMPELIIILVVALLIFGPKKLPEMGSSIGKSIKEFKKGMNELNQPKDKDKEPEVATTAEYKSPEAMKSELDALEREIASKKAHAAAYETTRAEAHTTAE